AEARTAYLTPLDREGVDARARNITPLPFFATFKELTLIGYYTSEAGSAAIGYAGPVGARIGAQGPICGRIWNASCTMRHDSFDAIVVGSGITGGWAAKEPTEKGLRTLVLERGRHLEHGAAYVTEHRPDHAFPFRGMGDRRHERMNQPVQST